MVIEIVVEVVVVEIVVVVVMVVVVSWFGLGSWSELWSVDRIVDDGVDCETIAAGDAANAGAGALSAAVMPPKLDRHAEPRRPAQPTTRAARVRPRYRYHAIGVAWPGARGRRIMLACRCRWR